MVWVMVMAVSVGPEQNLQPSPKAGIRYAKVISPNNQEDEVKRSENEVKRAKWIMDK
jgi:hypothetical protein